ncbi:hypothetical protein HNQ79_000434 [Streptomyces candidus]|uniref:Uncharacterized protein n=2 Tax=Streptomyces candidus TaxID=67283 RepID=A0A7X0LNM1_9ACTN|nr:hypothetical protein [Streptomyces candidus]
MFWVCVALIVFPLVTIPFRPHLTLYLALQAVVFVYPALHCARKARTTDPRRRRS